MNTVAAVRLLAWPLSEPSSGNALSTLIIITSATTLEWIQLLQRRRIVANSDRQANAMAAYRASKAAGLVVLSTGRPGDAALDRPQPAPRAGAGGNVEIPDSAKPH